MPGNLGGKRGRTGGGMGLAVVVSLTLAVGAAAVWLWYARPAPIPAVPEAAVRDITPEAARKRLDSGEKVVLLDVRTPAEHAGKRIPGSILLPIEPVDELSGGVEKAIPDKTATVFVYCRSGRRSAKAAEIMLRLGYKNVYNLGGIASWPYETEAGGG